MEIDIGLDFNAAEAAVEEQRRAAPEADYTLQVVDVVYGHGKASGRPKLNWQFKIVNDVQFSEKRVFYNTSLPWTNKNTGQYEDSGVSFLVDVCKALGRPWQGGKLDTNHYLGLTCRAHVIQEVQEGRDRPDNQIARFLA